MGGLQTTWPPRATRWRSCKGTSQEGYLPPLSYHELEEAGIDLDMRGTHEVELLDGSKHTAKPGGRTSKSR